MIKIMIKIIEKELTGNCKKNTRLIFENVTASTLNQSRFKNPARSMNAGGRGRLYCFQAFVCDPVIMTV